MRSQLLKKQKVWVENKIQLTEENKKLGKKNEELGKKIEELGQKIKQLDQKNKELDQKNKELDTKNEELGKKKNQEVEKKNVMISDYQTKLANEKQENLTICVVLEENKNLLKEKKKELKKRAKKLQKLEQELKEKNECITDHLANISELHHENGNLELQIKELGGNTTKPSSVKTTGKIFHTSF